MEYFMLVVLHAKSFPEIGATITFISQVRKQVWELSDLTTEEEIGTYLHLSDSTVFSTTMTVMNTLSSKNKKT